MYIINPSDLYILLSTSIPGRAYRCDRHRRNILEYPATDFGPAK